MLIEGYRYSECRTPNHMGIAKAAPISFEYKGIQLPTLYPDIFDQYSPAYMRELFDIQHRTMEKELDTQVKYACISKNEAARTKTQYKDLYFFEKDGEVFCFSKDILMQQSSRNFQLSVPEKSKEVQKELFMDEISAAEKVRSKSRPHYESEDNLTDDDLDDSKDPRPEVVKPHPVLSMEQDGSIGISVKGIREITGYSYWVQMPWHTTPMLIQWQKDMVDNQDNVMVVDGSRQGGKSKGIAQKLIEESFIVGPDCMVAAALQETTEAIWDYMLDYIENFDEGDFEIKERKRYIQNNITGTRVHFRTLLNGAKGIRGKTLRFIVVDEAMLISANIFESIILPTQTTIADPRLVLLGTASDDTSCYMYRTIMDIKKGKMYNGEGQFTAKYISFSIEENPLASPKKVRYVLDNRSDPRVQREYFNKWGKLEDSLFRPNIGSIIDLKVNTSGYLLISIDPARSQDRSGYCVLLCMNGKIYVLESGEVPIEYKGSWTLQREFFKKLRVRYHRFSQFSACGDKTGVGDGAFAVFDEGGFPIKDRVHYNSGDVESEQDEHTFVVGKSLMINNLIDMFTEGTVVIPAETNKLLIEEMEYIQASTTRTGKLTFSSVFFDDITNSLMVGCYIAKKKRYIFRVTSQEKEKNTFKSEMSMYGVKKTKGNIW